LSKASDEEETLAEDIKENKTRKGIDRRNTYAHGELSA